MTPERALGIVLSLVITIGLIVLVVWAVGHLL